MIHAFVLALLVALVSAAPVRAARPGGLLVFLASWYEWWQVMKPGWLPDKPTGGCEMCTAFWLPGLPAAAASAWLGDGGWCVAVPFLVAVVFELAVSK